MVLVNTMCVSNYVIEIVFVNTYILKKYNFAYLYAYLLKRVLEKKKL